MLTLTKRKQTSQLPLQKHTYFPIALQASINQNLLTYSHYTVCFRIMKSSQPAGKIRAFTPNSDHTQPKHNQHYRNKKFIHNSHTGTAFPTLGYISIRTANVIFIITYTLCQKHYIGEAQNSLHTCLTQHLFNIAEGQLGTHLVKHFQLHPNSHLIIAGLENNDHWTCGQKRRAERLWINKLGTVIPRDLNELAPSPLVHLPFCFCFGCSFV